MTWLPSASLREEQGRGRLTGKTIRWDIGLIECPSGLRPVIVMGRGLTPRSEVEDQNTDDEFVKERRSECNRRT
jgi:hypothetical protein